MPERLGPDEVHLWIAALDMPLMRLQPTLDAGERRQAASLASDSLRRRFVARRGLRRAVLALYADQPAARLRFTSGARGKPELAGGGVCFSCSSSGDLALMAVARDRQLGVDVERLRAVEQALEIASRLFAPEEQAGLQALSGERRDAGFLRAWTRMEASLKACGLGLASAIRTHAPHVPAGQRVQSLQPVPGHVGAVTAGGSDWQIRWRSW